MTIEQKIQNQLKSALAELNLPWPDGAKIEHPADESHGDYASNVALVLAGQAAEVDHINEIKNPRALAEKIVAQLKVQLKAQPKQVPNLKKQVPNLKKIAAKIEVAGPGFINFHLNEHFLLEEMEQLITNSDQLILDAISRKQQDQDQQNQDHQHQDQQDQDQQDQDHQHQDQQNQDYQNKKIMVEFTDPNPFKQLHIGHLYSNIVGESIARLFEAAGAKVSRADYFGDVGMHAAKSVWGIKQKIEQELKMPIEQGLKDLEEQPLPERVKFLGEAYAQGATAYKEDEKSEQEIAQLNKLLYVIAQEVVLPDYDSEPLVDYKKHLEADTEKNWDSALVTKMYQQGRAWSLAYFETIYDRLGMGFDYYYPESVVAEYGMQLVEKGLEEGIFEESDGAIIYDGEEHGLHTRVFINSSGLPTYEAKELGLAPAKYKDQPYDLSLVITGNEINAYFQVLLAAMKEVTPELGMKTIHLGHGMVRLPEGKMSSRTGDIITAEWLLDEAAKRIKAVLEESGKDFSAAKRAEIAEKVGQAAIKYAFLNSKIGHDLSFDFEESLSFQGKSGPYLQYTHVRCQSVLDKAEKDFDKARKDFDKVEKDLDKVKKDLDKAEKDLDKAEKEGLAEGLPEAGLELGQVETTIELTAEEKSLLKSCHRYPATVAVAVEEYAPHQLCTYLHQLAQKFNVFYAHCPIVAAENEAQRELRLLLTTATATILEQGLQLLGIETLEEM